MFIARSDSQLLSEIYLQIIRPVCNSTVRFVATFKKEREKKRHLRMSVGLHLCRNLSLSSSGQNIPVRIDPQSAKHCRGKTDTSLLENAYVFPSLLKNTLFRKRGNLSKAVNIVIIVKSFLNQNRTERQSVSMRKESMRLRM